MELGLDVREKGAMDEDETEESGTGQFMNSHVSA